VGFGDLEEGIVREQSLDHFAVAGSGIELFVEDPISDFMVGEVAHSAPEHLFLLGLYLLQLLEQFACERVLPFLFIVFLHGVLELLFPQEGIQVPVEG
jgi:hypothetical protein